MVELPVSCHNWFIYFETKVIALRSQRRIFYPPFKKLRSFPPMMAVAFEFYQLIFLIKTNYTMKKLAFAFSAVVLCLLFSCNDATQATNAGGMSDKAKKNSETNQAIIKMFEKGDFSKLGDYIATDAVDHTTPKGEVKGLDSIRALFNYFASMSSDTKIETVKEMADDNYVMSWIKQSWTAKVDDPMMGMKAGDKGNMESIEVTKYNSEGKVTDHWGFINMNDMMKMMPQMPKDTTGNKK